MLNLNKRKKEKSRIRGGEVFWRFASIVGVALCGHPIVDGGRWGGHGGPPLQLHRFGLKLQRGAASQVRICPTLPCEINVLPSGVKARKLMYGAPVWIAST